MSTSLSLSLSLSLSVSLSLSLSLSLLFLHFNKNPTAQDVTEWRGNIFPFGVTSLAFLSVHQEPLKGAGHTFSSVAMTNFFNHKRQCLIVFMHLSKIEIRVNVSNFWGVRQQKEAWPRRGVRLTAAVVLDTDVAGRQAAHVQLLLSLLLCQVGQLILFHPKSRATCVCSRLSPHPAGNLGFIRAIMCTPAGTGSPSLSCLGYDRMRAFVSAFWAGQKYGEMVNFGMNQISVSSFGSSLHKKIVFAHSLPSTQVLQRARAGAPRRARNKSPSLFWPFCDLGD